MLQARNQLCGAVAVVLVLRGLVVPWSGKTGCSSTTSTKGHRVVYPGEEGWTLQTPAKGSQPGGNSKNMTTSTFCTCAKCGSTSFYAELYKIVFGKEFDFAGPPFVQKMDSERWEHLGQRIKTMRNVPMNRSFALIRDPKERLMSAYRSKIRCGDNVDRADRIRLVKELVDMAGLPMEEFAINPGTDDVCMNETSYLHSLLLIHRNGDEGILDAHFRPQNLVCFLHVPPSEWSIVSTIGNPQAKCRLKALFEGTSFNNYDTNDCSFIKTHGTPKGSQSMALDDEAALNEITSEEYEVLGPYL